MQLEVGLIVEGKVTGITKFGAFVEIESGKTGLVHISEVSNVFVKEVKDHLSEGQSVKVKVLNAQPGGKIELSIKQAMDNQQPRNNFNDSGRSGRFGNNRRNEPAGTGNAFEDMMNKFKKLSDDKLSDVKKNTESRRGGRSPGKGKAN